jgi:hypothetical protein
MGWPYDLRDYLNLYWVSFEYNSLGRFYAVDLDHLMQGFVDTPRTVVLVKERGRYTNAAVHIHTMLYDYNGIEIRVGDWVEDNSGLQGEVTALRDNVVRVLIEREGCDNRYAEDRTPEQLTVIERDDSLPQEA